MPEEETSRSRWLAARIAQLTEQCASVRDRHSRLLAEHHARFHPVWGQLLKTGYQNSRYAHQMERFACLYTSHVANLAFYSPSKSYRYAVLCRVGLPLKGVLQIIRVR